MDYIPQIFKPLTNIPEFITFNFNEFKTGKGQYAEGDVFLGGIDTPTLSKIVNKYKSLPMSDIGILIKSKFHEERMAALGILKKHFEKASHSYSYS